MALDPALSAPSASPPAAAVAKAASKSSEWDFSFHNLIQILNPLEHLPIVGTIYRAITGTSIGVPERIADDALYGGLWGAVSGAADAAFEAITGKDLGATVLALFTGSHRDTAVAHEGTAMTPARLAALSQDSAPAASPDVMALKASLSQKGVDGDLAERAMAAYRKSMTLPSLVPAS
jgi:hypothetical protein